MIWVLDWVCTCWFALLIICVGCFLMGLLNNSYVFYYFVSWLLIDWSCLDLIDWLLLLLVRGCWTLLFFGVLVVVSFWLFEFSLCWYQLCLIDCGVFEVCWFWGWLLGLLFHLFIAGFDLLWGLGCCYWFLGFVWYFDFAIFWLVVV